MRKKDLSERKFYEILATRTGLSPKTIKKVFDELFKLVVLELRSNGVIHIPNLFRVRLTTSKARDMKTPQGGISFIPESVSVRVAVKGKLKEYVKGDITTFSNNKIKLNSTKKRNRADMRSINAESMINEIFEKKEEKIDFIVNEIKSQREKGDK